MYGLRMWKMIILIEDNSLIRWDLGKLKPSKIVFAENLPGGGRLLWSTMAMNSCFDSIPQANHAWPWDRRFWTKAILGGRFSKLEQTKVSFWRQITPVIQFLIQDFWNACRVQAVCNQCAISIFATQCVSCFLLQRSAQLLFFSTRVKNWISPHDDCDVLPLAAQGLWRRAEGGQAYTHSACQTLDSQRI